MARGWLAFTLTVVVLAGTASLAVAQAPPGEPVEAPEAGREDVLPIGELDVSQIDQILRGDAEVMQGEMFTYDPAGRRDPFRSLLSGLEEDEASLKARPPGLAGMLIEELTVAGIIETSSGILAFVQGRDKFSYIIRPGTKLYNGEVKEILPDKVIFRQQVVDPKQSKPYEDVVREIVD